MSTFVADSVRPLKTAEGLALLLGALIAARISSQSSGSGGTKLPVKVISLSLYSASPSSASVGLSFSVPLAGSLPSVSEISMHRLWEVGICHGWRFSRSYSIPAFQQRTLTAAPPSVFAFVGDPTES